METPPFDNKHQHTLESIFQNPVPGNLKWHDIIGLVEDIGTVKFKNNGQLTFTINGVPRIFHRALDKDCADPPQTLDLRHFLESVGIGQNSALENKASARLLVAISQSEALVFRSDEKGTVPEHLHPLDSHGGLRQLKHTRGSSAGAHAPENLTYYEAIAQKLVNAQEVLLMGNGKGASSAMNHFMDYLETHHKDTATHIVGALTVDLEALTEGQLLKEAREFYRNREPVSARDHQGVEVG
jgi:hypothetical protein